MSRRPLLLVIVLTTACGRPRGAGDQRPSACDPAAAIAAVAKERNGGYLGRALRSARDAVGRCDHVALRRLEADLLDDIGLTTEAVIRYRSLAISAAPAERARLELRIEELARRPAPSRETTPAERKRAAELYLDGVNLRLQGSHDLSLRQLRRAYSIAPHPLIIVQIALTHHAAGNMIEARRANARALAIAESMAGQKAEPLLELSPGRDITGVQIADRLVLTVGPGTQVATWSRSSGRMTRTFSISESATTSGLSGDGNVVAMAGERGLVRAFDTNTGATLFDVTLPTPATALAIANDGSSVVVGDRSGQVRSWSFDGGAGPAIATHGEALTSLIYLADGSLLSAAGDGSWQITESSGRVRGHGRLGAPITAAAVSPDGARVALATGGAVVQRSADGAPLSDLDGAVHNVACLAYTTDGLLMATYRERLAIIAFDAASGQQVDPGGGIYASNGNGCIDADPRTGQLVVAQPGGGVWLQSSPRDPSHDPDARRTLGSGLTRFEQVAVDPRRGVLVAAGARPWIWNASGPQPAPVSFDRIAFDDTGGIAIRKQREILQWEAGQGWQGRGHVPGQGAISSNGIAVGTDGDRLWVAGEGGLVDIAGLGTIEAVEVSPNGALAAAADGSGAAVLVDVAKRGVIRSLVPVQPRAGLMLQFPAPEEPQPQLAFSPDGRHLAVGVADFVIVWAVDDGTEVVRLASRSAPARLGFDPTGRWLAVAEWSGELTIYTTASWRPRQAIRVPAGRATSLAFAPDEARLFTASASGPIDAWDLSTGRLLGTFASRKDEYVAISGDGKVDGSDGAHDLVLWRAGPIILPGFVGWQREHRRAVLRTVVPAGVDGPTLRDIMSSAPVGEWSDVR